MRPDVSLPVLLISHDPPQGGSAAGRAIARIAAGIEKLGYEVTQAADAADGRALVRSNPGFGCVMLNWDLPGGPNFDERVALQIVELVRSRSSTLPIFLLAERTALTGVPLDVTGRVDEYVWALEDTPDFIAGRVVYAIERYAASLLPPFFGELVRFTDQYEYSWHTPGHTGGTAFLKSASGREFHDFYGEALFRSDLSVSVEELGSLLDHTGVTGEAERHAARIFGSDMTFFVTNGTSTANQIVAHSCVVRGDVVLADRNAHKSVNYALTVTGAVPVYLAPTRNGYGIIGPIPAERLVSAAVSAAIGRNPLSGGAAGPVLAIVTNSTYDGLCYDVDRLIDLLGETLDRVHFDEAWFAYARFNPIYRGRFGMGAQGAGGDRPTIFATQSTHKLLAALSQASMIHVRSTERAPVEFSRFNEAFMMHGSTSPNYPLIASLDVSAKMMEGASGRALTDETLDEAIAFRKTMVSVRRQLASEGDGREGWFFGVWQPDRVEDPETGRSLDFVEAPDALLRERPECWTLDPGAEWHGFSGLDAGYCMLDPIKVTVIAPGIDATGTIADWGIPAPIVSLFLDSRRVTVEKTGDYVFLLLFSMGITQGKWGTLLNELLEFKRLYDAEESLESTLPDLGADHPDRYRGMTLRGLADEMHAELTEVGLSSLLDEAFDVLPEPALTPAAAFERMVRGEVEHVPVDEMGGRVAAVMVVPYPPGIPILMPGERAGEATDPILAYLSALQSFDRRFPGFGHDVHGVDLDDEGAYRVMCLTGADS